MKLVLPLVAAIMLVVAALPGNAQAQVSVTLGAQEMYDDNIFLEDDVKRPPFVITDDLIEEDVKRGRVPTLLGEEIDGEKNDDLITTLSLGIAGNVPVLQQYATTTAQGQVAFLLFADQSSQDRVTLDGRIESEATEAFLRKPYYANLLNEFTSSSGDVSSAQGTATRTTQVYTLTGRSGIRNVEIAPKTDYSLGYIGSLHLFLGELRFEEEGPGEVEEQGADYHSHTAETEVGYDVTKDLRVALVGNAGVQLFTNAETSDIDEDLRDENTLDRANYTGTANVRYQATQKVNLNGSVGVSQSNRFETPQPTEVTTFDRKGVPTTVTIEREKNDTTLIFRAGVDYDFEPGSKLQAGVEQSVGTDIDGDRIATRSVYGNGTKEITDRLSFILAGRYLQYSIDDALQNAVDRFEGSTSLNYLLTQQVSLQLGYNYVDQKTDDNQLEDQLSLRAEDYKANRVFIGVNAGFVGLPLQ